MLQSDREKFPIQLIHTHLPTHPLMYPQKKTKFKKKNLRKFNWHKAECLVENVEKNKNIFWRINMDEYYCTQEVPLGKI